MKKTAFRSALAFLGTLAAVSTAQASNTTLCGDSQKLDDLTLNPGYIKCSPMSRPGTPSTFDLNPSVGSSPKDVNAVNSFFIEDVFQRVGLSSGNSSPFVNNPFGLSSGLLQLLTSRSGYFVIGLQATDPTAQIEKVLFYQFKYTAPTSATSIWFDTLGFDATSPALEAAALYLPAVSPPPTGIPEPVSWTLVLLSLGLMGVVKRRGGGG